MADPVLHTGIAPRQAVLTLLPAFCCHPRAQVQETQDSSISPTCPWAETLPWMCLGDPCTLWPANT